MSVFACDLESTGLLTDFPKQENPRIHCFGLIDVETGDEWVLSGDKMNAQLQSFLSKGHTLVMHNGITYDGEVLKYFGYDISKSTIIDTLPLSYYLEPERDRHGLDGYGKDFNVLKPVVTDWESLSQDEYNNRVLMDCRIQRLLWLQQRRQLSAIYTDGYDNFVSFLMWKMEQQRIQQECRWLVDIPRCQKLSAELEVLKQQKFEALKQAMPMQKIMVERKPAAKPFKQDGTLSATGEKWQELMRELGKPVDWGYPVKVLKCEEEPNPASPSQIKDWLLSLGWQPDEFKYIKDDDGSMRKVPQVALKGGLVTKSVEALIEDNPAVGHLAGLGIIKHRQAIAEGFIRDAYEGTLCAGMSGLTNTLRLKHREIVNLPAVGVAYGSDIRGSLLAREGCVLLGSDLSSLEDRIKHHFQFKFDPEYVKTQMDKEFDPHLLICGMAGLLSDEEIQWYKDCKADRVPKDKDRFARIDKTRKAGKGANYSLQYGAGVETCSRAAGVSTKIGKQLVDGYKKLNWSIDKIASLTEVKRVDGKMWQFNPISKFWYSLRTEKDRFSTLIQGTGAYVLDMWLWLIRQQCQASNLPFRLLGQFHDELILEVKEGLEDRYEQIVKASIKTLSDRLALNRELGCDVQFGKNYSEIH